MTLPAELRARLEADYRPVRALRSPMIRAMAIVPIALIALFAAPVFFNVRLDAPRLGFGGVWGLSLAQAVLGVAVLVAALRESVPGRGWDRGAVVVWLVLPIAIVIGVTLFSWNLSPVVLQRGWWLVGVMCFAGSASTALPVVAVAAILASRAYPLRPAIAGLLLGLGAGLIADAGWRIFCHFSEPAHVLSAHLAAVIASALVGSVLAVRLARRSIADSDPNHPSGRVKMGD
jgi:hypothetical protein